MADNSKLEKVDKITTSGLRDKIPAVFLSYIPEFPKDEEVKKTFEEMEKVVDIYQQSSDLTLRLQITEEAFNRLQNRHGMKGQGYSRLQEVISGNEMEYYLVVSPYTNVDRISKSKNPNEKALTLVASYYSVQTDDETINFQLAVITANGVSEVEDRSEVYPRDLLKVDFINKTDAEQFIKTPESK